MEGEGQSAYKGEPVVTVQMLTLIGGSHTKLHTW